MDIYRDDRYPEAEWIAVVRDACYRLDNDIQAYI